MTDRRGSALPGAPPLPPGNPPSDIDYSSVEEIYCATKNIPLPDTMSNKDSDSDSSTSSSSDERTSSSESEYDDSKSKKASSESEHDDSTTKKAKKSKGLKRKKPESSDSSDESESEEEVESASGRKMYGARPAASITEKKKLASHHKKFVAKHFSKFKKQEIALKALKENNVPTYNSHFLKVKLLDPVISDKVTIPAKAFERSDKRFRNIEGRLYAAARPLLTLLGDVEKAEDGIDKNRVLLLTEAALTGIGQAAVETKNSRRQAVLGNVLGDHSKAAANLKQKGVNKTMDADPEHLFGNAYIKKFGKDLKVQKQLDEALKTNKRLKTNKQSRSSSGKPSTSSGASSGALKFKKSQNFKNQPQVQASSPLSAGRGRGKPSAGYGARPGGKPRYVCFIKSKQSCKISKSGRKIPFFNKIAKIRNRTKSVEHSDRVGLLPCSSSRSSWREDPVLPEKLAGIDPGSLDTECSTGESHRMGRDSCPGEGTKTAHLRGSGESPGRSRSAGDARSEGHRTMQRRARSVCRDNFPEGQARWRQEAYLQCEAVESVHRIHALQAGRNSSLDRPDPTEGLDVQDRFVESVLERTISGEGQTLDEVQVARPAVCLSNLAVRVGTGAPLVDQAPEASCSAVKEAGGAKRHIHGRCLGRRPRSRSLSSSCMSNHNAVWFSWVRSELTKEYCRPYTNHGRLSWLCRQLDRYVLVITPEKNLENPKCLSKSVRYRGSYSETPSKGNRSAGSDLKSGLACSSPLQKNSDGANNSSAQRTETLRHCVSPQRRMQERAKVVDSQPSRLEWQKFHRSLLPGADADNVGCVGGGLGLSMRQRHSSGSLDVRGSGHAHQPQRVVGSVHVREGIYQGQRSGTCASEIRQCHDSQSDYENGGDKISESVQHNSGSLEILSGQGNNVNSFMAERHLEPDSRSGVSCFQGFEQLEVRSSSVQGDHRSDGHAGGGSVCRQNQFSAPCVCELEARPSSSSYRCFHDQMARQGPVVHVPSILHGREMLSKNSGRESNSYSDHPYMASADILSTVATNVGGRSHPTASDEQSSARTQGRRSSADKHGVTDASSMEGVRRNVRCEGLSGAAKALLQGKLAPGTESTYASPWNNWCGWCDLRGLDPVSAPVAAITNWLAEYQGSHGYSAMNTARSAISAYHDRVSDGQNLIPVGQHDLVKDLLDCVKAKDPPKARYTETWDVNKVLDFISELGPNANLSIKQLTYKLAMLVNLVSVTRTQELAVLKLSNLKCRNENKVVFGISDRTKTGREKVTLYKYQEKGNLDPVACLESYLTATQAWRHPEDSSYDGLFLALNMPHKSVKPCTIARWLTEIMDLAGINTETYRAHSVRAASTSKSKQSGLSCAQIIKAADWSNARTFRTFYHKDIEDENETVFAEAVLKL